MTALRSVVADHLRRGDQAGVAVGASDLRTLWPRWGAPALGGDLRRRRLGAHLIADIGLEHRRAARRRASRSGAPEAALRAFSAQVGQEGDQQADRRSKAQSWKANWMPRRSAIQPITTASMPPMPKAKSVEQAGDHADTTGHQFRRRR